jgi:transcriptional regulator with XRE-family HTH domain
MDAFDEILARTPETVKRQVSKNLAIAVRIANVLKEQGKTQRDLARLLGKSESEISRWLTGLHNLELKTIYKIEEVLGTEIVTVTQNLVSKNTINNRTNRQTIFSGGRAKRNLEFVEKDSEFTIIQNSSRKVKEKTSSTDVHNTSILVEKSRNSSSEVHNTAIHK